VVFIGQQACSLWDEWHGLQAQLSGIRQTDVIGYPNISPNFSDAERPDNWFHDEGDFTYLWGGWDPREGHHWFRIDRGDLEVDALSLPVGRDVIRAIDEPLIEARGGPIWGRIPREAPVVGLEVARVPSVYPLLVLSKVQIVNDVIEGRPILVYCKPLLPPIADVAFYAAVLDGRRVTMGTSGYFRGRDSLLYDRESESLWIGEEDALRAIAGPLKGRTLRRVAHPSPVAWGDWCRQHPESRLLVGSAQRIRCDRVASPSGDGR
jgi:hypothetical protein